MGCDQFIWTPSHKRRFCDVEGPHGSGQHHFPATGENDQPMVTAEQEVPHPPAANGVNPWDHKLTTGRRKLGLSNVAGPQGMRYGTTARCSCGWRFNVNTAPSRGGTKIAQEAHQVHLEDVNGGPGGHSPPEAKHAKRAGANPAEAQGASRTASPTSAPAGGPAVPNRDGGGAAEWSHPGPDSAGFDSRAESPPITTRDIVEIRNAVWSEYLGHRDPTPGDEGRPYFRVSKLAFCPRSHLMWRAGIPATRVETDRERQTKEGKFERGRRIEREVIDGYRLAGVLLDEQVKLWDTDLEVQGNADALWGGAWQRDPSPRAVYWSPDYRYAVSVLQDTVEARAAVDRLPITMAEVKSTSTWAIQKQRKEGPAPWYRGQLGGYRLLATRHPEQVMAPRVDRYEFVVLDPDGNPPLTFEADPADADQAEDILGRLVQAWHTGNWPACRCGLTPGMEWEAKRCDYLNPEDPSECCGNTLLDRLTASVEATQPTPGLALVDTGGRT